MYYKADFPDSTTILSNASRDLGELSPEQEQAILWMMTQPNYNGSLEVYDSELKKWGLYQEKMDKYTKLLETYTNHHKV